MTQRYAVRFDGHLTTITEHPDGPWPRWQMARAATIEHLEDHVRECLLTLGALRRAAFGEYKVLVVEMAGSKDDDVAQVQSGGTLTCKRG